MTTKKAIRPRKAAAKPPAAPSNGNGANPLPELRSDRLGEFRAGSDQYRGELLGFRMEEGGRVWLCKGEQYTDTTAKFISGNFPAFVLACLIEEETKPFLEWLNDNPQPVTNNQGPTVWEDIARWLVTQYTGMDSGKA